ncbi:hypothetical protein BJ508DRAFT_330883 [Ascobolus immersus RN42]|uniref:Uncharacterized protein n=1 Tax=Ascobolus immersus RN42 TaxID=1160509 RepID=A0A3N4HUJ4_ASCIM|nr:hypothetical protein BJ508DRAFT_330883 [Ascobolus immersus RN42]
MEQDDVCGIQRTFKFKVSICQGAVGAEPEGRGRSDVKKEHRGKRLPRTGSANRYGPKLDVERARLARRAKIPRRLVQKTRIEPRSREKARLSASTKTSTQGQEQLNPGAQKELVYKTSKNPPNTCPKDKSSSIPERKEGSSTKTSKKVHRRLVQKTRPIHHTNTEEHV